jgi:copper chaperone CopZ
MGRGDVKMITMPDVDVLELAVAGMRCNGCVQSVQRALDEAHGVEDATVDLAAGRASIRGSGFDRSMLAEMVRGLGFEVEIVTGD